VSRAAISMRRVCCANRAGSNDWKLWKRDSSRLAAFKPLCPCQAFPARVPLAGCSCQGDLCEAVQVMQSPYGIRQAPGTSMASCPRTNTADATLSVPRQRSGAHGLSSANSAIAKSDIFEDNEIVLASLLTETASPAAPHRRGLGGAPGSWSAPIVRSYLEFTFRAEYAYDYGMPQWLARMTTHCRRYAWNDSFLAATSSAITVCGTGCTRALRSRDAVRFRTLSRPYIQRNVLESLVQQHVKGEANFTTEITAFDTGTSAPCFSRWQ